MINGGLQFVPQIADQIIYLDFDGEITSYNNDLLTVDDVKVENSGLTADRIAAVVSELNANYSSRNVLFVTSRPENKEYSTIYVGRTSAFDKYGNFAGLAETVDKGNLNKSDNAFVMLDSSSSNAELISCISHEADHLLGTLDHGITDTNAANPDLTNFAAVVALPAVYVYSSGVMTSSGNHISNMQIHAGGNNSVYVSEGGVVSSTVISAGGNVFLSSGGAADHTDIYKDGGLHVYSGAVASNTKVRQSGYFGVGLGATTYNTTIEYAGALTVWGGGVVNNNTINQWGAIILSSGAVADTSIINADGGLHVYSGAVASNTTVKQGGFFGVGLGATTYDTLIDYAGALTVWGGGTVHVNEINQWGAIILSSGAVANSTTINPDGGLHIYNGAVAFTTEVTSGARLGVGLGGSIFNTELANTATLTFYEGAIMTGWNSFEGTVVTSGGVNGLGAYVHFELDDRTSDQNAILDNIGNFYSVGRYSMEVSYDQAPGTYDLAGGAFDFTDRITLYIGEANDCGSLAAGDYLDYDGKRYTLQNNNGVLALNITRPLY